MPDIDIKLGDKRLVIAIDGPAASGKSTTAKLVAEKLGYLHLETGAMYRAFTLKVLRSGVPLNAVESIAQLVNSTRVELRNEKGSLRVFLDGADVTGQVRSAEVTRAVSAVSSIAEVREAMVREQRRMGEKGGIVLEGRDIGTVVFPNADLKIYMVASLEGRSRRRMAELEAEGMRTTVEDQLRELRERDRLDSTRTESPLTKAEDAVELDTSDMTIEDQVAFVLSRANEILEAR